MACNFEFSHLDQGELPEADVVADHELEVPEVVRDGAVEEDVEGDGGALVLDALHQVGQVHRVAHLRNEALDIVSDGNEIRTSLGPRSTDLGLDADDFAGLQHVGCVVDAVLGADQLIFPPSVYLSQINQNEENISVIQSHEQISYISPQ